MNRKNTLLYLPGDYFKTEEKEEEIVTCPLCEKDFSFEEFKKSHKCPYCGFEDLYYKKLRIAKKLAKCISY